MQFQMINQLNFLFSKQEKSQAISLILFIVIGMLLEVFGIAILIPTISLLINEDYLSDNSFYIKLSETLELIGISNLLYFFLALIFIIFLLKSIFQVFITYRQKRIVTSLSKNVGNKLYHGYISQPYLYFTEKNRSKVIHMIQTEMIHFFNFFESFVGLIAEVFITLGIYFLVLYIEPKGTLILTFFYIIASILYFSLFQSRLKRWGEIRINLDHSISKHILESLGGIKNVIINNLSENFIDYFNSKNLNKAKYSSYHLTAAQLPRIYFEFVAVTSIISFIILLIYLGNSSESLIIILTVFGAVSFKLLPSANKIINYYQSLGYYNSSLKNIYNEISSFRLNNNDSTKINENFTIKSSIEVNNISFSYNKNKKLLNQISFKIKKGEIVGIKGPSGSGKSTLIDIFTGLIKPDKGNIKCDGLDIHDDIKSWQSIIGYVPQSVYLIDDTIEKNITLNFSGMQINKTKIDECLKKLNLYNWIKSHEEGINLNVGEEGTKVSGGQKQRIGIASALYKEPKILILDESTNSLDIKTEKEIMNSLNQLAGNMTIIVVSHKQSVLDQCDKVFTIKN